jgi:hypothetical protein
MKAIKESEISVGNMSGKAGIPSLPFGKGFFHSGNNGSFGTNFTPSGEPEFKTYKNLSKMKKRNRKMKKFKEYNEDATASLGNTGGMGAIVSAQPSSTAGDVAGSTIGSGDIGSSLGTYTKPVSNIKKKKKRNKLKKFDNFKY